MEIGQPVREFEIEPLSLPLHVHMPAPDESLVVWNFHIGGYQVCEKWLKDRKGRTLTKDDLVHYQKIAVALAETIRIMAEIDKVINSHGGWPGAFSFSAAKP